MKHKYSLEQENYLLEKSDEVSRRKLMVMFNNKYNTNLSYTAIAQKCASLGCEPKLKRHNTAVKANWVIAKVEQGANWESIRAEFECVFDCKVATKTLNRIAYARGVKRYPRNHYSDEQREWLADKVQSLTYPELTESFNQRFDTRCTQSAIQNQCISFLGVRRGDNHRPHNELPVGSLTNKKHDGLKYVKVAKKGTKSQKWKPLHKTLWEQHHGRKIKRDEAVIFLDGDKRNFAPENLYLVTKPILNVMNLNKWLSEDRESTLTAVKLCELIYALKDIEQCSRKEIKII